VLRAEQQLAGRSAEDLLNDEAVRALAAEYWLLCDEVGMEQPDLMSDLAEQMASPQARCAGGVCGAWGVGCARGP
jgi:hypothetical protein